MSSLVCDLLLRDTANFITHLQAPAAKLRSGCRQSNLRRQAERCSDHVERAGDGIFKINAKSKNCNSIKLRQGRQGWLLDHSKIQISHCRMSEAILPSRFESKLCIDR